MILRHRHGLRLFRVFTQSVPFVLLALALAASPTTRSDDDLTATEQVDAPLPRPHVNPQQQQQRALQRYLQAQGRSDEQVSLIANETAFFGLFLRETRGSPQGGVLLLHDQHQHGHWPTLIAPLREYLPSLGWTTLSIELVTPPPTVLPPRGEYSVVEPEPVEAADPANAENNAENNTENETTTPEPIDANGLALTGTPELDDVTDNEPALPRLEELPPPRPWGDDTSNLNAEPPERSAQQRYEDDMQARITAAMRYLQQQGQLNTVIIASGHSANWAAGYVQANQRGNNERGLALILVDAFDDPLHSIPLHQQLSVLDLPILDLISALNRQTPRVNQHRAGIMRHQQRDQYQQLVLPAYDHYHDASSLLNRRIHGWLRTHMKGNEMKTAE